MLIRKLKYADTNVDLNANILLLLEANKEIAILLDIAYLKANYYRLA